MGKQVRLFLSIRDMQDLENELSRIEPMLILHARSSRPTTRIVNSSDLVEDDQRNFFFYYVRTSDLDAVTMHEVKSQGYWTVDESSSPVIELIRCGFDGSTLRPGRFYYNDAYYDANNLAKTKSAEFRSWATKVFSRTRKMLKYDKEIAAYVGEEADRMRTDGIEFAPF